MMRVNVSLFPSLGHGLTTFIISQFLLTLFLSSSMMPMLRPCVQILYWLLSGCSPKPTQDPTQHSATPDSQDFPVIDADHW